MNSELFNPTVAILQPSGYVTAANASDLQDLLYSAVNAANNSLILVDMRRVEFLDSAGLMTLVSAFRQAQALGKRFSLCALAPSVRIIFELTQLDRALEIFEDRQAFESTLEQLVAA